MVDFRLTLQELAFDGAVVEAFEKTSRGLKLYQNIYSDVF